MKKPLAPSKAELRELKEKTAAALTIRGLQTFFFGYGFYHLFAGRGFGAAVICWLCVAWLFTLLPTLPGWIEKYFEE